MVASILPFTILSFMLLTVNGAPVRSALTRVVTTTMRNAAQSAKSVPRTSFPMPANVLPKGQPSPLSRIQMNAPVKPQESLWKDGGKKVAGGALVGFGALGAQALDDREVHETESLERRTIPLRAARVGTQIARQGIQAARTSGRQMTRMKPMTQPVTTPQAPASSGSTTLKWMGLAGTAGVGEYYGQKLMNGATERLNERRRELQDDSEDLVLCDETEEIELSARTIPVAANALRAASRNAASSALRSATMSTARTTARSSFAGVKSAAVTTGKTAFLGGAALTAGVTEGVIQNFDKESQKKVWNDPVGSITKMVPATKAIFGSG